jgi:competence protein ComEA
MTASASSSSALAFIRESAWASVLSKAALVVIALLVLAWIGGARAASSLMSTPVAIDAGALPMAASASAAAPPAAIATAPAPTPSPSSPPAGSSHARATPDDPVYVNQANADELRRLPGVGVKRAEAIVALRQRVGRFQRVEDLLRVKGVGRATVRKWRPLIRLDAPVAPTATIAADATAP